MYELEFQNPTFKYGRNLTVRLGRKWADRLSPGDVVTSGRGLLRIVSITMTTLGRIPTGELEDEHDPACRKWDGLMAALQYAYPSLLGIPSRELNATAVTLLYFYVYMPLTPDHHQDPYTAVG